MQLRLYLRPRAGLTNRRVFLIKRLIKYDIVSSLDVKGVRLTVVVRMLSNKRGLLLDIELEAYLVKHKCKGSPLMQYVLIFSHGISILL